ncbi:MAG: LL-diaminopimelate aminotransferase, partial [Spirochaetes bacterium]|nr:LL-diaminopimelate aminotransferase [Spirochaetota bacterium]
MAKVNKNYLLLQGNYLFAEIANRVKKFSKENPDKKIIRLGIGDVTEPLVQSVISGLKNGVDDMAKKETFQGYTPDKGYEFLIDKI